MVKLPKLPKTVSSVSELSGEELDDTLANEAVKSIGVESDAAMAELKSALSEAEESEKELNFVDNSDQAKAILISNMLTDKPAKIKHLSEIYAPMMPPLIVLGTVAEFLEKKKKLKCNTRRLIYSEILTLMISYKRKGRGEFVELGKGEDGRMGLIRKLREKFGGYAG